MKLKLFEKVPEKMLVAAIIWNKYFFVTMEIQ